MISESVETYSTYQHTFGSRLAWFTFISLLPLITDAGATGLISTPFENPQPVQIQNLPMGSGGTVISTEEPFISRDGRFLFFNTATQENNKDLHYAKWQTDQWQYQGEIGPDINTAINVEGNPSMDSNNQFFFVDSGTNHMISKAIFTETNGLLDLITELEAVPARFIDPVTEKFHGNMGVEASSDGDLVFYSRATWPFLGNDVGTIEASDLAFVTREGGEYMYDPVSVANIMQNINTDDLEYAASISADKRELFFTRLASTDIAVGNIRSKIMYARRDNADEPFPVPTMITSIGGDDFVEGPAISADGESLYYHKREGDKFRLYKVTRKLTNFATILSILQLLRD